LNVVSTIDRPDLVPIVTDWLWQEFWRPNGYAVDVIADLVSRTLNVDTIWRSFILLENDVPLATASLALDDLDTRPDLNPWLAGVYVVPEARGRGLAAHVVAAVEAEARRQSIATLWLFTHTAEHIYERIGWRTEEHFQRKNRQYALMRRDLAG
jgi:GNAT superfamily N-acetyltransferase